jgi:transposase-like protein
VDVHKNARLTPKGRGEMVRRVLAGEASSAVATAFSTTVKTVGKWVSRFLTEGPGGIWGRFSQTSRV